MGASVSTPGSIDTKLIDKIATDYILSMNFQDMKNMNTEAGCSKMVLIVENILKKNTTEIELSSMDKTKQGMFSLSAPPSGNTSIFVFPEGDEEEKKIMDISDAKKKLLICRNIAKFYVRIAHVFAAIIMTVNPKYEYRYGEETKTVSIIDKKDIPEEALASANVVLEKNYCSERETLLTRKSRLDDNNNISITIPYCNLNEEIEPLGQSTGIKELEELFKDNYDPSSGIFTMSTESEKQYKKVVQQFYSAMHSVGSAPNTFTDFKSPKYNEERGCSETALQKAIAILDDEEEKNEYDSNVNTIEEDEVEPPFKETYIGTNSGLYKEFKNNILLMKQNTSKNTGLVFENLGKLFDLGADPITIHPNINPKTIEPLIVDTREKIAKLYLECEINFQKGLEIFRNIVYQNLAEQTKKEISSLESIEEKTVSEE